MTPIKLKELKEFALDASGHSWEWKDDQLVARVTQPNLCSRCEETGIPCADHDLTYESEERIIETDSGVYPPYEKDRKFIAAANPQTVLALIEDLESAREALSGAGSLMRIDKSKDIFDLANFALSNDTKQGDVVKIAQALLALKAQLDKAHAICFAALKTVGEYINGA